MTTSNISDLEHGEGSFSVFVDDAMCRTSDLVPDECSGWVPVEKDNKQYCWHSSVVDYEIGAALVLRPSADDEDLLEIAAVPLANLLEQTLELIGTNVNGNPYGNAMRHFHLVIYSCQYCASLILILKMQFIKCM